MPPKGDLTRERIVDRAAKLASRDGIEGLSLGALAIDLGMSKSGLFAHFRSKEDMQLQILRGAVARFQDKVIKPALRAPRGVQRVKQLFKLWLDWLRDGDSPGGCIFFAAASELDDKDGPVRDYLADQQKQLLDFIAGLVEAAMALGELRPDIDARQVAFELQGIMLATNHSLRLLRDPSTADRARRAFENLHIDAAVWPPYPPTTPVGRRAATGTKKHDRSSYSSRRPGGKPERSKS